jgi:2-iminobutanoate/2-iminopropanoate deaminase
MEYYLLIIEQGVLMSKHVIKTNKAPTSQLYSQAIKANGFIFLSGQIAIDPSTGKLIEGTVEEEFQCVFNNIEAILESAGATLNHIVRVEIYLKDIGDYPIINKLYLERMVEPKPARQAMQVGHLPLNAKIEITITAVENL